MPGFNLVRNSKLFFTSNVNAATGEVTVGTLTAAKTQELAVMNGFSFSQNVDAQTITVSEAGDVPARGQRSFNSALQPVEFSFSTYMRPRGTGVTTDMDEKVLWNALFATGECQLAPSGVGTVGEFGATTTGIVRTGATNVVAFTWASLNLTVPNINVGSRVNIGGVVNSNTVGWNGSGTVTGIAGGALGTCTGMTVAMDIAPPGTGNPTTVAGPVTFSANSAALRNPIAGTEPAHVLVTAGLSNRNQLQKFGLVVIMDQSTYVIDNCVLDQGQVEFGLDGIAMIAWTGKGTVLRTLAIGTAATGTFGGSLTGTYAQATVNTSGNFITNKISTAVLKSTFMGGGTGNKTYSIAITGGSLSIANNVTYITPETLGVVNRPIGYFTGTRAISGSLTAYLKTGAGNTTTTLLNDLLAANSETKYYLEVQVGGGANAVKVEFEMPGVTLQVPTVDVQDVVSTTINFVAQGAVLPDSSAAALADASTTSFYDVEASNDLLVRYYSA